MVDLLLTEKPGSRYSRLVVDGVSQGCYDIMKKARLPVITDNSSFHIV